MAESIYCKISKDRSFFHVHGGDPRAKDDVFAVITQWPGWKRVIGSAMLGGRKAGIYIAPCWAHTALSLAKTTLKVEWDQPAKEFAEHLLASLRGAELALGYKFVPALVPSHTNRIPLNHQCQAVAAGENMEGRLLLSDDMGLGKTSASLWMADNLKATRILVICPASVKFNWQREVKATLGWPCYVIDGTRKKRADIFADLKARSAPLAVIVNYDLLIQLTEGQVATLKEFVEANALICDEGHYLKSRTAARTQFVANHLAPPKGGARVRILCSGTPIWNMVDDLWSQIELIRPGTWTSYWDFTKRYCVRSTAKFGKQKEGKIVGSKNVAELNRIVNTMQIRRLKDDVLGLPPKVHTYPELELTGDHLKVYKAMKHLAVLELGELNPEESIFSPQARSGVIAALRCEQIAQGFVGGVPEPLVEQLAKVLSKKAKPIPGRPKEIIFPDSPKLVWLVETIQALLINKKKVVVFSRFNAPLFWLAVRFIDEGYLTSVLHGGLPSKGKDELIQFFQDGLIDLLFVQVKMAQGFNLHNAQDCIFLGRDWAPAVNMQAEDRLHRIGQKGTVNVQIPFVRNSIEKLLHTRLMDKQADADQALKTVTIKELMENL